MRQEYEQARADKWVGCGRQIEGCRDIEGLLSRAKLCEAFEEAKNLKKIQEFNRRAEGTMRREVDFVSPGDGATTA